MPDPVDELAGVALFAGIDAAGLAALAGAAFTRRLARGQILFVAGEPTDHVYLLRRGRIKIGVSSEHGGDLTLAVLEPGESLGEIGAIDGGPRSADAVALDDAELLAVPARAVRDLLDANPAAMRAVAVSLAAGMRRLTDQAADLVFLDLPRRLAKLLLGAARLGPTGVAVAPLRMSQTELAARLGVTRQSLNRTLMGLSRRGWVDVEGSTITLSDVPAMTRFVRT